MHPAKTTITTRTATFFKIAVVLCMRAISTRPKTTFNVVATPARVGLLFGPPRSSTGRCTGHEGPKGLV